ncbi:Photosystem I chlorophyll a apoprotein A2 [compost metagenome]
MESKGIKSSRIQTSTFGEKDPIAKNTLADGSDTEEGRRFNRRVEISVLKDGVKTGIVEEIEVPAELKK